MIMIMNNLVFSHFKHDAHGDDIYKVDKARLRMMVKLAKERPLSFCEMIYTWFGRREFKKEDDGGTFEKNESRLLL